VVAQTPFVWQVNVVAPEALGVGSQSQAKVEMDIDLTSGVVPVGPLAVAAATPDYSTPGTPVPLTLWVTP